MTNELDAFCASGLLRQSALYLKNRSLINLRCLIRDGATKFTLLELAEDASSLAQEQAAGVVETLWAMGLVRGTAGLPIYTVEAQDRLFALLEEIPEA